MSCRSARPMTALCAAPDSGGFGRHGRGGPAHRPRAGHGRAASMRGNQSFNRATQAQRQPGSTFKPIVYVTGARERLDPGVDCRRCAVSACSRAARSARNASATSAAAMPAAQTMRWGLEQSRNLMTVRIAYSTGMDKVVTTAKALGVGSYQPVLAIALGAGETTVLQPDQRLCADVQRRPRRHAVADRLWSRTATARSSGAATRARAPIATAPTGPASRCRAARRQAQAGHRCALGVPDRPLMEGVVQRGTAMNLRQHGPAARRQDRHHHRPDQRLVHRR